MSPEQAEGMLVDGRTDIYSLGVIFYEMLTGERPFQGETPVKVILQHLQAPIPTLPENLNVYQPLLEKMLAKDREERFSDAGALVGYIKKLRGKEKAAAAVPPSHPVIDTLVLEPTPGDETQPAAAVDPRGERAEQTAPAAAPTERQATSVALPATSQTAVEEQVAHRRRVHGHARCVGFGKVAGGHVVLRGRRAERLLLDPRRHRGDSEKHRHTVRNCSLNI